MKNTKTNIFVLGLHYILYKILSKSLVELREKTTR